MDNVIRTAQHYMQDDAANHNQLCVYAHRFLATHAPEALGATTRVDVRLWYDHDRRLQHVDWGTIHWGTAPRGEVILFIPKSEQSEVLRRATLSSRKISRDTISYLDHNYIVDYYRFVGTEDNESKVTLGFYEPTEVGKEYDGCTVIEQVRETQYLTLQCNI